MQIANHSSVKLSIIALMLGVLAFGIPMRAQVAPPITVGDVQITGLPEDWTQHHLVFSDPGTEEEAIRNGTYEKWLKVVNNPRYVLHQLRRGLPVQGPAADAVAMRVNEDAKATGEEMGRIVLPWLPVLPKRVSINKDWNEALGAAGSPDYNVFPVKWTSNFTTASCANDFVTYPTGQTGSASQASIVAYYNLYSGCTGTVPEVDWAYNTGGAVTLAPVASLDGTQLAFIQTVSSSSDTGTISFTAAPTAGDQVTIGSTQYIFETRCTSGVNCVVASGTTNTAKNLEAAINNSSTQCGSRAPCFYNASGIANQQATATVSGAVTTITNTTGGAIVFTKPSTSTQYTLSPATEIISGGAASLVIMRVPLTPPGTGTVSSPIAPTSETPAAYFGCTAPCMTTIALNGSPTDGTSNPFYDYVDDTLYVGDSAGKLHRFSPVFNGTPAEVTTSWPVQLARGTTNDTNPAGSPVYDYTSGYVFVGSTGTAASGDYGTGGYLYAIGTGNQGTTTGSIHGYSGQLDAVWGIRDAPLVDSTAGKVYVFAGNDGTSGAGAGNCNVNQFATSFTTGSGSKVTLGTGGPSNGNTIYQMSGTFDNNYYTSSNGASPSGYLYVGGTGDGGPLYQVAITNNVMGTVVTGPELSYATWYYGRYSPITEFFNNGTDYIFLSIFAGSQTGCNYGTTQSVGPFYGCVMTFNVTTPSGFSSSIAPTGTLNMSSTEYTSPSGGIIIDNAASSPAGASQMYFETNQASGTTPCTGICAVQASQSAP